MNNLYTIRIFFKQKRSTIIYLFQVCAFWAKQNILECDILIFPQPGSDFRNGDKRTTNFLIDHSKRNIFFIQLFSSTARCLYKLYTKGGRNFSGTRCIYGYSLRSMVIAAVPKFSVFLTWLYHEKYLNGVVSHLITSTSSIFPLLLPCGAPSTDSSEFPVGMAVRWGEVWRDYHHKPLPLISPNVGQVTDSIN